MCKLERHVYSNNRHKYKCKQMLQVEMKTTVEEASENKWQITAHCRLHLSSFWYILIWFNHHGGISTSRKKSSGIREWFWSLASIENQKSRCVLFSKNSHALLHEIFSIKACEMKGLQCFKIHQQYLHVQTIVLFKALNQNHAEPTLEVWELPYVSYP